MKKLIFVSMLLWMCIGTLFAQQAPADSVPADTVPKPWTKGGQGGLTFNQVGLSNWAAGGQSNMTLIGNLNLFANRKVGTSTWDNSLDVAYGFIKNNFIYDPEGPITKAEDKVELNSKFGKKAWSDRVFYSGLGTFRTQFAPGFARPGDSVYISKAFAPATLLLAVGLDFKPADFLSIFVSPVSGKVTLVLDDSLSQAGAFGVNSRDAAGDRRPGSYDQFRMEFGATVKVKFKKDIMKNVGLESNLELFSNYIDRPQNVDVRWTNALVAKVNKFIVVNFFLDMIYDNDVNIPLVNQRDGTPILVTDPGTGAQVQAKGPRLQIKEVFGVGFSYKF